MLSSIDLLTRISQTWITGPLASASFFTFFQLQCVLPLFVPSIYMFIFFELLDGCCLDLALKWYWKHMVA